MKNNKFVIFLMLGLALSGISSVSVASDNSQDTFAKRLKRTVKVGLTTMSILGIVTVMQVDALSDSVCHSDEALATCEKIQPCDNPGQMIVSRPTVCFKPSQLSVNKDYLTLGYGCDKCEDRIPESEAFGHLVETIKNCDYHLNQAKEAYRKAVTMLDEYKQYKNSMYQLGKECPAAAYGDTSLECSSLGKALELSRQASKHLKMAEEFNEHGIRLSSNDKRSIFDIIFLEDKLKRDVINELRKQIELLTSRYASLTRVMEKKLSQN